MFVFPDQKICWWKRRNLVFSSKRSKTSHWNYRSQRQMDGEKLWNYCSMVEKSTKQIKKWCNNMVNKNSKCKQQTAVLLFFLLVSHQEFIQHQNLYKKNWMFKQSKNKLKPVHLPINQNYVIFFFVKIILYILKKISWQKKYFAKLAPRFFHICEISFWQWFFKRTSICL